MLRLVITPVTVALGCGVAAERAHDIQGSSATDGVKAKNMAGLTAGHVRATEVVAVDHRPCSWKSCWVGTTTVWPGVRADA
jgi:hypothetical protein